MKELGAKKLLLTGTSSDLKAFDEQFFLEKRKEGYQIFSFSDSIVYLDALGISSDYFTYIDPHTIFTIKYMVSDISFLNDVTSIIPNIFDNDLEIFKRVGFTSPVCRIQNELDVFNTIYKNNIVPNAVLIDPVIRYIDDEAEIDFKSNFHMFNHQYLNIDKFSCYLLPLIFYMFKELESVACVGFGHFEMKRLTNDDTTDYSHYIHTFQSMEETIKKHLAATKIDIAFIGEKSLFESLS